MSACELALQEAHFVVPGHRHQVDVPEAPVVVLLANAGRARLPGRLGVEPLDEAGGRLPRVADRRLELATAAGGLRSQRVERLDLAAHRAGAGDPEVVGVAGEVAPCLREQRRHDRELTGQFFLVVTLERERVGP